MIQNFHEKASRALAERGIVAEFEILKCIPYMPRTTFVCALFRLENPYSDDKNYVSGMFRLIKDLPQRFQNFSLRVYLDDSVLGKDDSWRPLYDELFKHEFITVIRYNFPQFKTGTARTARSSGTAKAAGPRRFQYHDGLFGTVVRLLPLFRFNKIQELTVNIDIDGKFDKYLVHMKFVKAVLNGMRVNKNSLILMSYSPILVINDLRHRALHLGLFDPDPNVRFSMYGVFCARKMDPAYFLDWMECVKGACPLYSRWQSELRRETDCSNETSRVANLCAQLNRADQEGRQGRGTFYYGIDEFLLTYLGARLYADRVQFDVLAAVPELLEIHKFIGTFRNELFAPQFIQRMYDAALGAQSTGDAAADFLVVDGLYAHARDQEFLMNNEIMRRLYAFLTDSVASGLLRESLLGPEPLRAYVAYTVGLVSKFEYPEYFFARRSLVSMKHLVGAAGTARTRSTGTRTARTAGTSSAKGPRASRRSRGSVH